MDEARNEYTLVDLVALMRRRIVETAIVSSINYLTKHWNNFMILTVHYHIVFSTIICEYHTI